MKTVKSAISFITFVIVTAALASGCSKPAEDAPAADKPMDKQTTPMESKPAPAPAEMPKPAATTAAAAPADGKKIYDTVCMACHALAIAGAPKFGDAEVWAPRVAAGMDKLYSNSINGYQGEKGIMPPKGGRLDLSDDAIRAAVDYMVESAK